MLLLPVEIKRRQSLEDRLKGGNLNLPMPRWYFLLVEL